MARYNWKAHTIDVEQAFVQSDDGTREVFVLPQQKEGLGGQCRSLTFWKLCLDSLQIVVSESKENSSYTEQRQARAVSWGDQSHTLTRY